MLKPSVEEMGYLCESSARSLKKEQAEQLKRMTEKLREDWLAVNRQYTERHNRWSKCYENWKNLHNACWNIFERLDKLQETLSQLNASPNHKESASRIPIIEQEIGKLQSAMNNVGASNTEILSRSSPEDVTELQSIVDNVSRRWQHLLSDFNAQKEKYVKNTGRPECISKFQVFILYAINTEIIKL